LAQSTAPPERLQPLHRDMPENPCRGAHLHHAGGSDDGSRLHRRRVTTWNR
jgi:hypothetical protein